MTTQEATMTTREIADRFYQLSQEFNWKQIQEELYDENAQSIEPEKAAEQGLRNVQGIEAIKNKAKDFDAMVEEMHGGYTGKPIIAGNHFAVAMGMEATFKGMGRQKMDEIAVYEVKDGKVVKEQFFF